MSDEAGQAMAADDEDRSGVENADGSRGGRIFPVEWGPVPSDDEARACWIEANIRLGRHEQALGIPVPWLRGGARLAEIERKRIDAVHGSRRLAEIVAKRFGPVDRGG